MSGLEYGDGTEEDHRKRAPGPETSRHDGKPRRCQTEDYPNEEGTVFGGYLCRLFRLAGSGSLDSGGANAGRARRSVSGLLRAGESVSTGRPDLPDAACYPRVDVQRPVLSCPEAFKRVAAL